VEVTVKASEEVIEASMSHRQNSCSMALLFGFGDVLQKIVLMQNVTIGGVSLPPYANKIGSETYHRERKAKKMF